jgi:hypothetical protein
VIEGRRHQYLAQIQLHMQLTDTDMLAAGAVLHRIGELQAVELDVA